MGVNLRACSSPLAGVRTGEYIALFFQCTLLIYPQRRMPIPACDTRRTRAASSFGPLCCKRRWPTSSRWTAQRPCIQSDGREICRSGGARGKFFQYIWQQDIIVTQCHSRMQRPTTVLRKAPVVPIHQKAAADHVSLRVPSLTVLLTGLESIKSMRRSSVSPTRMSFLC